MMPLGQRERGERESGSVKFCFVCVCFRSSQVFFVFFRLMVYVNDPLLIEINYNLLLMTQTLKGRVRLIKCSDNGVNSVQLMSIPVIKSQNVFY